MKRAGLVSLRFMVGALAWMYWLPALGEPFVLKSTAVNSPKSPIKCPALFGGAPALCVDTPEAQRLNVYLGDTVPDLEESVKEVRDQLAETKAALGAAKTEAKRWKDAHDAQGVAAAAQAARATSLEAALQHTREALKAASSGAGTSVLRVLKWVGIAIGVAGAVAAVAYAVTQVRSAVETKSSALLGWRF